ncbi:uncharacterized protein N7483_012784 [Penicillium malachiteum]|uniref:uncharacterized protein n=1 Tax=Penicillium malachiteum TaxID=1324776 RepID=UPI0025495C5A|nr:uncharacterized protein N7483_012784 [Penicillium malachiteum]KAJ5715603.1 hypothetical protein N7483_012784 [Penicillium malachiteum]
MSLLPTGLMESQLSLVDLLTAMFPSPGELEVPENTIQYVEKLREWCQDESPVPSKVPSEVFLAVNIPLAEGEKSIQVNISVPLKCEDPDTLIQPPSLGYVLRQPDWMTKAEVAEIATSMPESDVLEVFEYIQSEANRFLEVKQSMARAAEKAGSHRESRGQMVRVWFYFPSLSTREKRDDMVNLAPSYSLTGFVLAGKPGVLCLEGGSTDIDSYMSFIKTHSWGDIPSHQKKVSERFRQTTEIQRVFSGMEEITNSLGERGGQRANRGDMQAFEVWLGSKGLQEAFEKVIF